MSSSKTDPVRPADSLASRADDSAIERSFAPGLRLSRLDIGVLLVAAAGCGWLAADSSPLAAGGIAFVVGHFFLFCNVFRIRRVPELIWAAVFTTLAVATVLTGIPGWAATFVVPAMLTVVLVAIEMRHVSYHGLFWRQFNPQLPEYWRGRQHERSPCAP